MNKKEQSKLILKNVFKAINDNFHIVNDFVDTEGHGYFSFSVLHNDHEFEFDLIRGNYEIIGHLVKGDQLKPFQDKLEQRIQHIVDEVVENTQNQIQSSLINQGLGLQRA
jgi:hypothetical protein